MFGILRSQKGLDPPGTRDPDACELHVCAMWALCKNTKALNLRAINPAPLITIGSMKTKQNGRALF